MTETEALHRLHKVMDELRDIHRFPCMDARDRHLIMAADDLLRHTTPMREQRKRALNEMATLAQTEGET